MVAVRSQEPGQLLMPAVIRHCKHKPSLLLIILPPVLTGVPADATVQCDNIPAAATVTATDNCDPTITVTFTETAILLLMVVVRLPEPGLRLMPAVIRRQQHKPSLLLIILLRYLLVFLLMQRCSVMLFLLPPTVTATDNCDPTVPVTFTENSNTVVDGCGTITRTWTATDACGNTTTETQTFTVVDNTPPVLTGVPADATVQCDAIPAATNCNGN